MATVIIGDKMYHEGTWYAKLEEAPNQVKALSDHLIKFWGEHSVSTSDFPALIAELSRIASIQLNPTTKISSSSEFAIDGHLFYGEQKDLDWLQNKLKPEPVGGGCTLSGPGRGDCEHFVGMTDATDEYGRPEGWCWSCWRVKQIEDLHVKLNTAMEQRDRESSNSMNELFKIRAEKQTLSDELQHVTAEGDALRSVPVKVRFDVTPEDIRVALAYTKSGDFVSLEQWYLDYLAAHAVIDAPAGVPSVEELAWIGSVAYANHKSESGIPEAHAAAAAIRDRVLAGVQAKGGGWELDVTWEEMSDMWPDHDSIESGMTAILDLCRSRIRPRAYTDADVEALARALHEAEPHMPPATYKERNEAMARAALDWMGATVGECKECEKLKEQRKALRKIVLDGAEEVRARIDAARAGLEGE